MKRKNIFQKTFLSFIGIAILVIIWEIFADGFILPKPSAVILAFFSLLQYPETWYNILRSIFRVYLSLAIALILGLFIGSLDYFNRPLSIVFNALFYPGQYIGSAVWSILAIVIFGLSPLTAYFIITIVILPNIFVAVQVGIKELNKNFMELGKVYTKKKTRLFKTLVIPQITPHVLIGLIRSNAVAWKIVVTAEIFISVNGLGFMVNNYYKLINMVNLFATVLIIILIGLFFDKIIKYYANKIKRKISC